jgi:hypothetical protein
MAEKLPPKKIYQDQWGTGTREGYEDRPQYQPRTAPKKKGSGLLRALGGLMIVGGLFWGAYLFTVKGATVESLEQNRAPAYVCGAGVVISLLGKYIRL